MDIAGRACERLGVVSFQLREASVGVGIEVEGARRGALAFLGPSFSH